ncbi:MAG: hypothetical protein DHS20C20_11250 [Ardenticatenaceae bacterium]|nr:MAG: hypothetical protein DHS20C20_11250 [Ardenticatenaceae bacterium]
MKLLALRCPTCAQSLKPQNPEVVVLGCANCGTAVSLHESGLDTIPLQFATPAVDTFDAWLPLWVFNGRVNIANRQTQGRNKEAQQHSEQLWGSPRRLYVPAWELPTETASQLGGDLVQRQPTFQQTEPPNNFTLVEAIVTPDDALKMLEFVVLSIEAARKDWLKELQFTIEAAKPQLWAIPAVQTGSGWQMQPLLK